MELRCPICKRIVKAALNKQLQEAKIFPFCSQRCKLVDLGAWLDCRYIIVSESSKEPAETNQ